MLKYPLSSSDQPDSGNLAEWSPDSVERLVRAGKAWEAAQAERDTAIVDAFQAGISGPVIAGKVGLSVAAVYRIKDNARGHLPPSRRPGITITLNWPMPALTQDIDAMKAVLVAADPYWIRTTVAAKTVPGRADVSIRPEGWPQVAAAIRAARSTAGPGWSVNVTSSTVSPTEIAKHPTT